MGLRSCLAGIFRTLSLGLLTAVLGVAASGRACAADYYFAVDVPTALGSADYTPSQIVLGTAGSFSLEASLPAGFQFGALHRRPDGIWLISPAHPVTLGGTDYEPRDVFSWDGGAGFGMVLDGGAEGIPASARIDSLFMDSSGALVLSFDVPVNLAGVEYGRSDLVSWQGGLFSLYWNAEGPPQVPASSNLSGADLDPSGTLVVSFDVPTNLGGTEYLPGQLAGWTGSAWFPYLSPASWPLSAQLRDFAFVPGAGALPDGTGLTGVPLTVSPAGGGDITLSWGPGCGQGDTDYEIYEGAAGVYYSHSSRFCSTGGLTSKTFTPPAGNAYYLVVPRNALREGSYGAGALGAERPPGTSACLPQEIASCP